MKRIDMRNSGVSSSFEDIYRNYDMLIFAKMVANTTYYWMGNNYKYYERFLIIYRESNILRMLFRDINNKIQQL